MTTWVKFRHNEAAGRGDWEWRFFVDDLTKDDIDEYKRALEHEYSGHDKYRGCDIEIVVHPPEWVIEQELRAATNKFRALEQRIRALDEENLHAALCATCVMAAATMETRTSAYHHPCVDCGRPNVLTTEQRARLRDSRKRQPKKANQT